MLMKSYILVLYKKEAKMYTENFLFFIFVYNKHSIMLTRKKQNIEKQSHNFSKETFQTTRGS